MPLNRRPTACFMIEVLDPMILILKLDLDMIKMYHNSKNKVSGSIHSKFTGRQAMFNFLIC